MYSALVYFFLINVTALYKLSYLTLRTSEAGIPALRKLLWRCTSVYRLCTNIPVASHAGIPALRKLPCGVARRYTDFAQTSLWRRTPVYRLCAIFPVASHAGIPALFSKAYWHQNARVIEIQTRQPLNNNLFHKSQQIFVNKFCIWTPSGQRTSWVQ